MKKIFAVLCLYFLPLAAQMPEPYCSINDLPFDGHGWFGNAEYLEHQISHKKPKVIIEVGSWLGCSTRFMAGMLPRGGKLYAVDTWKGSPNEPLHLQDPRMPYLYQLFLSNVKHAGLTDRIVPVRMDSIEASKALNVKADLIYLDASHDTESVLADIIAWYPHLREGGVFCGDDWLWDSVRIAVMQGAEALGKKVWAGGNFWYYYD